MFDKARRRWSRRRELERQIAQVRSWADAEQSKIDYSKDQEDQQGGSLSGPGESEWRSLEESYERTTFHHRLELFKLEQAPI